jgi:hypothetical protein
MTRVVFSNSTEFPASLRDLNDAPQWLFVEALRGLGGVVGQFDKAAIPA